MPLSYEDCLKKGLLRKIPPSKDQAFRSVEKAQKWLEEAKKTLRSEAFNSSVSASYLTMFHASRSILFLDGFREKSHLCVARYLDHYVRKGKLEQKWIDLIDHTREIRHDEQYDLGFFATHEDAEQSLESAVQFLERIERLLKSLSKKEGTTD